MEEKWKTILEESIQGLRFGSVEVVIHDGRITQIERRERFRPIQDSGEDSKPSADRKFAQSAARKTER
jgi:hypothetical protein